MVCFHTGFRLNKMGTKLLSQQKIKNSGNSMRIGISALRLHRQIGGIYAIAADTNKLGESFINIKGGVNKYE